MDINSISGQLEEQSRSELGSFDSDYIGFQLKIEKALLYFLDAMFPSYCKYPEVCEYGETVREHYLRKGLQSLLGGLVMVCDPQKAERDAEELACRLPKIYPLIQTDIIAGYQGDPAAKSPDEIILAYPAFLTISTYRVAHELYLLGQFLAARLMSEYAHRKTGIDIHPGATIGSYFFIDHGTGVVIGETTVIGDHVKLYQHVTLGAKSFAVAEDGSLVKGIKRHPNIGNNVVIYAGATILGGDVYIGDNCVIGGNVWLTESVEAGRTITQSSLLREMHP